MFQITKQFVQQFNEETRVRSVTSFATRLGKNVFVSNDKNYFTCIIFQCFTLIKECIIF